MYTIATLEQLRVFLEIDPSLDDTRLLDALESATAQIERLTGRHFLPTLADRPHNVDPEQRDTLALDDDLLRLDTLTNGDGQNIPLVDVLLIPPEGNPYAALRLRNGLAFVYDDIPTQAITISGLWGWHSQPAQMWRDSADTVQDNPLLTASTTLTVADADGADAQGGSPRFQVGQLLQIDDEMLWVQAVDTVANTLTVQRGANGTTAVDHAQGTSIDVYAPPADIRLLVLRWAAWLYRTPDQPDEVFPDGLRDEVALLRRLRF